MAEYKKYYKKQPQKKKEFKPVCSECLTSSEKRYYGKADSKYFNPNTTIPHNVCLCNVCAEKLEVPDGEFTIYNKSKKKKVEMLNWEQGTPTKKGNVRYIFIKEDGTETTLLPETGIKKGLKPKLIKK